MNKHVSKPVTRFQLNGVEVVAELPLGERLSEVLRSLLDAREVKVGCDAGDCGACTVLVNGDPICACLMPVGQAEGKKIETLKGLFGTDGIAEKLTDSFQKTGAAQCGICTPGMVVSATRLLRDTPSPGAEQVKDALGGVLCRCTGYRKIIQAVVSAGEQAETVDPSGKVGTSVERLDGLEKLTGTEVFGDDVAPAGTLAMLIIRSPYARADIRFGNLDEVRQENPGIVSILTASDVPGKNAYGVIPGFLDQPVFAETQSRFRGEAVAAIIGDPDTIRNYDPSGFPVEWEELPSAEDAHSAVSKDVPQLHVDRPGNIMCRGFVQCGDAQDALACSDVVVEGRFQSGYVEHAYIEPEAGFAELVDGRVEIHACTQAPVMDLESLEQILGLGREKIRIIPTAVGGGFGAKLDLSVQPFLALGALKTGKSVRLAYSRTESMQSTTKRHPSDITVRLGAGNDGKLQAMEFDGVFNTGAYASWGPTVSNRVPVHASGPYYVRDYRAVALGVYTNGPPSGAFRGFGVPQAAIAQECLFDELADKLGMDRLEFRILNALENNMPTVCGQTFEQGVGIKQCLETLRPAWVAEREAVAAFNASNSALKRGVGVAAGWYGCGNTSLPNPSTIKAGIRSDGTIVLHQGAMDIGQGANTVITQIFATALGASVDKIEIVGGDTDITPDAGKTSASRQTFVSGNAARLAGEELRSKIIGRVNASTDAELVFEQDRIQVLDQSERHEIDLSVLEPDDTSEFVIGASGTYDPPTKPLDENGQGEPYAQFGYAAHLAVVEVDLALGTVKPLKFVAAHDVGKAINPLLVEGQVHGGIAQGLGMALMEEYIPGRTENLHDYLIPTIGDIPPIETIIIEEPDAHGPYGAKGLGEHVLIPTAPALLNAIRDACGVRPSALPATPARVRAAIKDKMNETAPHET